MLRWYLVHTKPCGELAARDNLERQGYGVYLPLLAHSVRRCGRWQERIAPLFPRYLFLRVREGLQSLAPVSSSVGVTGIVRFGAIYSIVPDRIVRELMAREDSASRLHRLQQPVTGLVAGARIAVRQGAFDGLEGVFQHEAGRDRVVVLLNLLGRESAVCLSADSVSPVLAA
jgi:transcriptional antiterminator RfaH